MNSSREFHPEMLSRRSEVVLWVLAILSLATWVFLRFQSGSTHILTNLFVLSMLFAAGSTSLSNWMDRKTVLKIKSEGVDFTNGLRNISLGWHEIQEVRVNPTRFGKQVQISGADAHFQFRMLSIIERRGKIRSQMGFAAGEFILEQILKSSGLREIDQSDQGHYYARP
jgi:hypothetical protein